LEYPAAGWLVGSQGGWIGKSDVPETEHRFRFWAVVFSMIFAVMAND
jgi:hypothetical protein